MDACPGCFMKISYYTRKANCNTEKHDIQITGIDKYGTNCSSTACDDGVTYREAVFAVIKKNDMDFNFPEESGDPCFTTFRVSKSSCWTYSNVIDYYSPSGELISTLLSLRPCNSDCCLRELTVCFINGELVVTAAANATTYPSCTNANHSYPPGFANCYYTCDYLDNVNVTLKGISKIDEGNLEFDNLRESLSNPNNLFVNINVNNLNDDLIIEILKTNGDNLTVNLFDMTGKQIIMQSEQLSPKNNNYIIELSQLVSGTYVYNIQIDGILVKSDNIIILK